MNPPSLLLRTALLALGLAACTAAPPPPAASTGPRLSPAQLQRVGQRIWQNECAGSVAGLTSWNAGEDFASLGIGHFIWYPAGRRGPFEESFPQLAAMSIVVTAVTSTGVAVMLYLTRRATLRA